MGRWDTYWGNQAWLLPDVGDPPRAGGVIYGNGELVARPAGLAFNPATAAYEIAGDLWFDGTEKKYYDGTPGYLGGHLFWYPAWGQLLNDRSGVFRDVINFDSTQGTRNNGPGMGTRGVCRWAWMEPTGGSTAAGVPLWICRVEVDTDFDFDWPTVQEEGRIWPEYIP
jgi:hypothetical protein